MYIPLTLLLLVLINVSNGLTYEELAQETFEYQNYARQNPQAIMQIIQNKLQYFDGKLLREPGKVALLTYEGNVSYIEAIEYLAKQKPVNALKITLPLSLAALDHVNDQGPVGAVGHNGTQGETPFERMDRYMLSAPSAENIAYGITDPQDVVIGLIVDDGVPDRSHRTVLYSTTYRDAGVACGCHITWRCECDLTYAAFTIAKSKDSLPDFTISNGTVVAQVTECVATREPGYGSIDNLITNTPKSTVNNTPQTNTRGGVLTIFSGTTMLTITTASYLVYYFLF